jgi:hypothetical protein
MNLGKCPDCGNICSLNAASCPKCGRIIQPGDIVPKKAISKKYSQLLKVFAVIAGLVVGLIGMFLAGSANDALSSIFPDIERQRSIGWTVISLSSASIIFFICYLLIGLVFGFLQHEIWWKWGLWLVSLPFFFSLFPLMYLSSLGILFVSSAMFLIIVSCFAGACVGAYIAGIFKNKLVY